jgi:hypothetical protein
MGMGSERARDPMFEQFTWQVGLSLVGSCASGCKWGKRAAHVHMTRSHGCALRPDYSRLLTSHWDIYMYAMIYFHTYSDI